VFFRLCRFVAGSENPAPGIADPVRPGLIPPDDRRVIDLSAAGVATLAQLLNQPELPARLRELRARRDLPAHDLATVRLRAPVDGQEVWAAGVTYLRSKAARMAESTFSAQAYDRVYDAPRPELFFKALPEKVVGPGEAIGVRHDSRWTVPEPELALVLNAAGRLAGYTLGNDVSARDIEGENLLYLPQAKIYDRSCALGPWITVGAEEATVRGWTITLRIRRAGAEVFTGRTELGRLKRGFAELAEWLFRAQRFPHGVVLLTGTGIVPPDDFSLRPGDEVEIAGGELGELTNTVIGI
jgi:2-dehydro-3-deoxy-D-arabinonate dehydratase